MRKIALREVLFRRQWGRTTLGGIEGGSACGSARILRLIFFSPH